ncbi:MAG: adenylate/guanylate cyclase domain-containing protein [Alphaproteobacteria bacterium]|jgi:adenylate cyclase|nr:adenylate/guanylate cyclase domain-containing protein [Alphaproteobacteria bacterium]
MREAKRRLAAILSADVAGYSRLMGDDEAATVETLTKYRQVFADHIARHDGRVVDSPGDNLLAEFASPVEALSAAVDIQDELARRNRQLAEHRQMRFRIGLNLGDVIAKDDGTIYGDGVNVAARLESLATPGGVNISGAAFDQVRGKLDFGFDDLGEQEVKNIDHPVRAYRVVLDGAAEPPAAKSTGAGRGIAIAAAAIVLVVAGFGVWRATQPPATIAEPEDPVLALPTGPSIAVLPFDNLSGDPEQDYFVDGITEEIIAELTRFPELFVLARNTTFQFKGEAVDVRAIGRDLGARYVVEGSVRTDSQKIRVTVQMIDAETGGHLWAETYDRDLSALSIFAVQDDITQRIVGALAGKHGVIARVGERSEHETRTQNLAAHDCFLRALVYHHVHTEEQHAVARNCLERAIELDPTYVDALAELAYVYIEEYRHDYNVRPNAVERGMEVARRALDLDRAHPATQWAMALGHFSQRNLARFYAQSERAIELNPNDSAILGFTAHFMAPTGKWDRGLALMSKAMALNPAHPSWYNFAFFYDHYRKGEYDQALARAQRVTFRNLDLLQMNLAAVFGRLGRQEDAGKALAVLNDLHPGFSIETARHEYGVKRNFEPAFLEQMLDGLRMAGLPEGTD